MLIQRSTGYSLQKSCIYYNYFQGILTLNYMGTLRIFFCNLFYLRMKRFLHSEDQRTVNSNPKSVVTQMTKIEDKVEKTMKRKSLQ